MLAFVDVDKDFVLLLLLFWSMDLKFSRFEGYGMVLFRFMLFSCDFDCDCLLPVFIIILCTQK